MVPVHLSATDISTKLLHWIASWWPEKKMAYLKPEGWYDWRLPSTGADTAVEVPAKTQQDCPYNFHVVVILRLWTVLWRKYLGKILVVCLRYH